MWTHIYTRRDPSTWNVQAALNKAKVRVGRCLLGLGLVHFAYRTQLLLATCSRSCPHHQERVKLAQAAPAPPPAHPQTAARALGQVPGCCCCAGCCWCCCCCCCCNVWPVAWLLLQGAGLQRGCWTSLKGQAGAHKLCLGCSLLHLLRTVCNNREQWRTGQHKQSNGSEHCHDSVYVRDLTMVHPPCSRLRMRQAAGTQKTEHVRLDRRCNLTLAAPGTSTTDVPSAVFNTPPPLALPLLLPPPNPTARAPAVGSSKAHHVTRLAHIGFSSSPTPASSHSVTLFKL